jgi:Methyltransferase TYW3
VAVRSAGLALGSVVGYVDPTGRNRLLVSREYVGFMVGLLRERFESNRERIGRFEAEVRRLLLPGPGRPLRQKKQNGQRRVNGESTPDTRARRAKKREIGDEDELSLYEGVESLEVTSSATN